MMTAIVVKVFVENGKERFRFEMPPEAQDVRVITCCDKPGHHRVSYQPPVGDRVTCTVELL